MVSTEEKIKLIEEEIRKTPYHKATEHHIGKLRAKRAKLKDLLEAPPKAKGKKTGFAVKKGGDATVVLIGPPSVGKSTLLNKLTQASSKVGEYDFTTLEVVPGILKYKGAQIQLLDIPGLVGGAAKGRGRGQEILSVARVADLLVIMVDVNSADKIDQIKKELDESGVRLNQSRPKVKIKKLAKGGLKVISQAEIGKKTIEEVAREFGYVNAEINVQESLSLKELIDAFAQNRTYLPAITVVNKTDLFPPKQKKRLKDCLLISAQKGVGLDQLKEAIFESLALICVYLKEKGKEADFNQPLILKKGATIGDALGKISDELLTEMKFARVWGTSAKYPGQQAGLAHQLADQDVLSF